MTIARTVNNTRPTSTGLASLAAIAALFLLALPALLLLAACGGDSEEPTPSVQGTQSPAQTPTAAGTPSAQQTQTPAATPQPSAGAIDACSLLTKAEVETAIGASVTEPEAEEAANLVTCSYNDPETPIFSLVSVSVLIGEDGGDARQIYEMTKDNAADVETVAGVGDEAFWDSVLNGLEVLEGKYDVRIDVSPDGWDARAVAEELAAKALSRLP